MNQNTYLIGLEISTKISVAIGLALSILFLLGILSYKEGDSHRYDLLTNTFAFVFLFIIITIGVSITSFLVLYPLLNLLLQNFIDLDFYKKEISQGTLGLRVTSLILGLNYFKGLYNWFSDRLLENHKELVADYPSLQNIEPRMDDNNINITIVSQNIIYGAVTLLLWVFIFLSTSLLELKVDST